MPTIKKLRKIRKARPRILHNGVGFVPASRLIRKAPHNNAVAYFTPYSGEREIRRRVRQLDAGAIFCNDYQNVR